MSQTDPLVSAFAELYLQLTRTLDRRMAEHGASLARTKLLLCLQKRGPLRGTDIAEFFSQSPRTVTEAIDGLERDCLVERRADPSDRRAKLIYITDLGVEAAARTEPLRRQIVDQTFGILSPEERESLSSILEKLSNAMPAIGPAGALAAGAGDASEPTQS